MPRAFLIRKEGYENCPLKKRPLTFLDDSIDDEPVENAAIPSSCKQETVIEGDDDDQPQNLSLKPAPPKMLDTGAHFLHRPFFDLYSGVFNRASQEPCSEIKSELRIQDARTAMPSTPLEPLNLNSASPIAVPSYISLYYNAAKQPWNSVVEPSPRPLFYPMLGSDGQSSRSSSISPGYSPDSVGSASPVSPKDASARFQCVDCTKCYSTFSGLTKHRQFHCSKQSDKAFACKFCHKVYVSLGALKMHIRTHTLPCKCGVCGKAFSRPWLLQGHVRTHTGEKPFGCPQCQRAFADRSNLRAHMQTHSEVKKYSCQKCTRTFSRMSLLHKHEDGGCSGTPALFDHSALACPFP